MSEKRKIKKIEIDTLERINHKTQVRFWGRVPIFFGLLFLMAGGAYAAYRIMTGSVVASRFAVNNMNCPACSVTLKEVTGKIPGVVDTEVSLAGQDVIVKFRDKQTTPDAIRDAISQAGYPATVDGLFVPSGQGINDKILLEINGRPLFEKDLKIRGHAEKHVKVDPDRLTSVFSLVGTYILLQAADEKNLVVQPYEVESEVHRIMSQQGQQEDEFWIWVNTAYGSKQKFYQHLAQRIGIRKLIDEHVAAGVNDPDEKRKKIIEWLSGIFQIPSIRIVDPDLRQILRSSVGSEDWKTFWPRMIAGESDFKNLVLK